MKKDMKNIIKIILLFLVSLAQYAFAQWEMISPMPIAVSNAQSFVSNDKIYVLGGVLDSTHEPTNIVQVYDPAQDTWRYAETEIKPRSHYVSALYNNSLFMCGGFTDDGDYTDNTKAEVEFFNFDSPPVNLSADKLLNRIDATGVIYQNKFFLFGGFFPYNWDDFSLPYMVSYNLEARTMVNVDSTLRGTSLPFQQCSALVNNEIFIFGGVNFGVTKNIYKFNCDTKAYVSVFPEMLTARADAQAVVNSTSQVIITGGYNEADSALATTEVFEQTAYGYSVFETHQLNIARKAHSSVHYGDFIYVLGGIDSHGKTLKSVERFKGSADEAFNTAIKENFPTHFKLENNYPNPFNNTTRIDFTLEQAVLTRLQVFAVTGQLIKTLVDDQLSYGKHSYHWDGTDELGNSVASDVYFYRLITPQLTQTRKMILLK